MSPTTDTERLRRGLEDPTTRLRAAGTVPLALALERADRAGARRRRDALVARRVREAAGPPAPDNRLRRGLGVGR